MANDNLFVIYWPRWYDGHLSCFCLGWPPESTERSTGIPDVALIKHENNGFDSTQTPLALLSAREFFRFKPKRFICLSSSNEFSIYNKNKSIAQLILMKKTIKVKIWSGKLRKWENGAARGGRGGWGDSGRNRTMAELYWLGHEMACWQSISGLH
jgi:hypothetical protein